MDKLSQDDYVIIDEFLPQAVFSDIESLFLSHLADFTKAGIGALYDHTIQHEIRGDYTYWLDEHRDTSIDSFWKLVDEMVYVLKRYCFLSLSGFEFHFANYPPGAKYKKHLDQFNGRNNRLITLVIYLNPDWQKGDGGELEVFLKDGSSLCIEPLAQRCVMFKSVEVPHRVLESYKNRYSLSGWLLNQPAALGKFMG